LAKEHAGKAVILSTFNRTELYFLGRPRVGDYSNALGLLARARHQPLLIAVIAESTVVGQSRTACG
jgi:glutamyl-tRNA reductase